MTLPTSRSNIVVIAGIDASGKSSLVNDLQRYAPELNIMVTEPTSSSDEAKALKAAALTTVVDNTFVGKRERIFRDVNQDYAARLLEQANQYNGIFTTGNVLITAIAHHVMRQVIAAETPPLDEVVKNWESNRPYTPAGFILLHAPIEIINARIDARLAQGDTSESSWGFNSRFYLDQYQQGLLEAAHIIAGGPIPVHTFDTSQLPTEDITASLLSGFVT